MSTHLITGYAGKEHITSADQGAFNAAVMGDGEFVMEGGEQFRCQVISNNKVRIYDGNALMQGRHICIDKNTYEETTHENGTQGMQRIDLIVLTYTKDASTDIETATIEVVKGTPASSAPEVPAIETGDIIGAGALKNQMPLYKIPFDGLSIGEPVALFKTIPTLQTMNEEVKADIDEKVAEMEEKIEAGLNEGGKPVVSGIDDMTMIENYGDYAADAKTVGEEITGIKNSLDGCKFTQESDGVYVEYTTAGGETVKKKLGSIGTEVVCAFTLNVLMANAYGNSGNGSDIVTILKNIETGEITIDVTQVKKTWSVNVASLQTLVITGTASITNIDITINE